jgi:hypothetical protein
MSIVLHVDQLMPTPTLLSALFELFIRDDIIFKISVFFVYQKKELCANIRNDSYKNECNFIPHALT